MCMCVGGGGSSTRMALVCANSEDSRESVRSLQSALICADFYNSSKSKYIFSLTTCIEKKVWNTYKMYMKIQIYLLEKTKCSDSVLKFLIARLQWIGILAHTFSGPKIVK